MHHGSRRRDGRCDGRRDGYALLTAMIFSFIIVLTGLGFFAMTSYETRQAIYRQNSSEAFYLADGAIELARAKFLTDAGWFTQAGPWKDGWTYRALGPRGTCQLAVDTTTGYPGVTRAVRLLAKGHVQNADRAIEVFVQVPPTSQDLAILIVGDAKIVGNLTLGGPAHVNGVLSGNGQAGPGPVTNFRGIVPPAIYTDPAHFPSTTYYYVKGSSTGPAQAKIYDRNGTDITGANNLADVLSYNNGAKTFSYSFDSPAAVTKYFDETTGVFRKSGGDRGVVVNFGEIPVASPPGPAAGVSEVVLDGGSTIRATVINTRFTGVTEEDRLDLSNWVGALLSVKQITLEPRLGIAAICWNFEKPGASQAIIGTNLFPALVYVTQDVTKINANFALTGSIICLGDWSSSGGPSVTYNPTFISNLPTYLQESWPGGGSGTMKILRWREVASTIL